MDRGAWRATVYGGAESDVTEETSHTQEPALTRMKTQEGGERSGSRLDFKREVQDEG